LTTGSNVGLAVDSSGRVGIGTSSPDQLIHASSSTGASLRLERDSDTITSGQILGAVEFEGRDASGSYAAAGVRAKIETEATGSFGESALKFYTAAANDVATERWRIDSSGNLIANGTAIDFGSVAGGTGTPITNGGLLDDYESGTFTPTDGSGAGLTFTGAEGTYIKVGGQVTCWVKLTYPTTSDTTDASVQGFPFSFGGSAVDRVGGPVVLTDYGEYISALGVNSVSRVQIFKTAGYGPTNANLSGKFFWFYVTYNVS